MKTSSIKAVGPFLVVLSVLGVVGSASLAQAQTTWGTNAATHRGKDGQRFVYTCPAGGSGSATVWGTGLYTDDSAICIAAVHAGFISFAAGGTVTLEIRPGAGSYTGSMRNGVSTRDFGNYHGSFAFVTSSVSAQDLTGLWVDDTGGGAVYRVRQHGTQFYWIVDGTPKGSFVNMAFGTISGNVINVQWVDMPGSPSLGYGSFTLQIESPNRIVKVNQSGHYGAQAWTRQ